MQRRLEVEVGKACLPEGEAAGLREPEDLDQRFAEFDAELVAVPTIEDVVETSLRKTIQAAVRNPFRLPASFEREERLRLEATLLAWAREVVDLDEPRTMHREIRYRVYELR